MLKYAVVLVITFLQNSFDKKFLVMRITSQLKSGAVLLYPCNPPVMGLPLQLVGIFQDQCSGTFLQLL